MQPYRHLTKQIRSIVCVSALFVAVGVGNFEVFAQPLVTVDYLGLNNDGNPQWRVDVVPDASLFTGGEGSLAAEIGFSITGSTFLDATVNESVWAFETPGTNPFTDTITVGLSFDETNAFAAFGSDPVSETVELLTFTTVGQSGTLSWGEYTIDSGQVGEFTGARIAQAGLNFDNIIGSASFGISTSVDCNKDGVVNADDLQCACSNGVIDNVLAQTGLIRGDLDGNSGVEFADFLVMSANFGTADVGYTGGDLDCDGTVAFADFLVLSTNFGTTSAAVASVPEPATSIFLGLLCTAMLMWSRISRRS